MFGNSSFDVLFTLSASISKATAVVMCPSSSKACRFKGMVWPGASCYRDIIENTKEGNFSFCLLGDFPSMLGL